MNTIQKEQKLSKSKELKTIKNKSLVCLTRDNVAIVEAMIRNDSDYLRAFDKTAAPDEKYGGSSAYWLTMLKGYLTGESIEENYKYKDIIKRIVEALDRENSTHLNADRKGRDVITERLARIKKSELLTYLKDPNYKDMYLIRRIAKVTSAEKGSRTNLSFASKFCHYACYYVFEGEKYQDNYSIYDSVIRKALPMYLDFYGIKKEEYNLTDYRDYQKAIDAVRTACGEEISRNGFDHLLWFYHKGRI